MRPAEQGYADPRPRPAPKPSGPSATVDYSQGILGSPLPVVYGTAWVPGAVIYAPEARAVVGSAPEFYDTSTPGTQGIRYVDGTTFLAQVAFCQGPVAAIEFVARDGLIFGPATTAGRFHFKYLSATSDGGTTFPWTPEFVLGDAATVSLWSPLSGAASYLRQLGYGHVALMRSEYLVAPGGKIPDFKARVRGKLASYVDPNILAEFGTTVYNALPGDVIRDLVQSEKWGLGRTTATVVTATGPDGSTGNTSASYDTYCHAMGFYIGMAVAGRSAKDVISEILAATNSIGIWQGDTYKVIPLGDSTVARAGYTYAPPSISVGLLDDDFRQDNADQDPITVEVAGIEDSRNICPVSYVNGNGLTEDAITTEADDSADVAATGTRRADAVSLPCIRSSTHARKLSALMAARSVYNLAVFKFAVSWRYATIEPGDFLSLTHAELGLSARTVRVLSVEEADDGDIAIEAVEWNTGISVRPVYNPQNVDGLDYSPGSGNDGRTGYLAGVVGGMGDDNVLSADEKSQARLMYDALAAQGADAVTKAGAVAAPWGPVGTGSWTGPKGLLDTYLATITPAWDNPALGPSTIVGATWRQKWKDAYEGYAKLQGEITAAAQAAANSALSAIADIADDGIISRGEKPTFLAAVSSYVPGWYEVNNSAAVTALGSAAMIAIIGKYDNVWDFLTAIGFNTNWVFNGTLTGPETTALNAWMAQDTVLGDYAQTGATMRQAFRDATDALQSYRTQMMQPSAVRTLLGPSGTPSASTYLRGDGTWAAVSAGGGGTVTQIVAGTGLTGGTITTSGTIAVSFGSAAGTVCQGNDGRLSDSRPASDVYAWAKASVKPTYTAAEVGAATSGHTHAGVYEPVIAAGTTAQYWRGDKTWQALPTSLPASDVYAWAKAATKPTYTYSEVGALAAGGTAVDSDKLDGQHGSYYAPISGPSFSVSATAPYFQSTTGYSWGSGGAFRTAISGDALICGNVNGGNARGSWDMAAIVSTGTGSDGLWFRNGSTGAVISFRPDGSIVAPGNVTAYSTSDRRLKRDLTPIAGALALLDRLTGYAFRWDAEACARAGLPHDGAWHHGLVAQEVQGVLHDATGPAAGTDFLALKQGGFEFIALLVQAIKELREEVERLRRGAP